MPFKDKLRALREDNDINQTQLAEAIGTNQKRLSRLELGINEPTIEEIKLLCRYFKISADELLMINEK